MLHLYRLHEKNCKKGYARYDRNGDKCDCPIHIEGKLGADFLRKAVGTRSMTRARKLVVEAEERGSWLLPTVDNTAAPGNMDGTLVSYAANRFLEHARSPKGGNLSRPTVSKYTTVLRRLEAFCAERHLITLDDLTYQQLMLHKDDWKMGPQATANTIMRLRTFWKFCLKHDWCKRNVAKDLDMPLNYQFTEREPFTHSELERILKAARTIKLDIQQPFDNFEIETFCLLMRYSGMAIADASLFRERELRGDEVRYFRKKTRRHANRKLVVVPIPVWLADRFKRIPVTNGYYFCRGSDHLVSAVDVWHNRLRQVFDAAGIKSDTNSTSHRFRHSFATSLLTEGKPIELVSKWLGHSSIRITEKHYSHFVEERIQRSSDILRQHYAGLSERKHA